MAIRVRVVDGVTVALCAARSVEKPGDVYLDDAIHHALTAKFWQDLAPLTAPCPAYPEHAVMEREESNNANRADWDAQYGADTTLEERTG